jgi:NADH dehydrogenase FAD-containing subunit
MTHSSKQETVIVAGGGYAGVLAANRLAGKLAPELRIVLVTPGDALTDRIRLHEAAASGRDVEHALSTLVHPRVERLDARVVGIDPARHALTVEHGGRREELTYRAAILAMGSRLLQSAAYGAPHAFALADMERAHALHEAVRALPAGARIAIVGGGLTAVELSSELAESHPRLRVVLLCDELAHGLAGPARDALRRALARARVELREQVRVRALAANGVHLQSGQHEAFALSVFAAGFTPAALGPAFALPQSSDGRVAVDTYLRPQGVEDVFVAGDLAAPPAETIGNGLRSTRMACASAMPLGAHAADQVARLLRGRALQPYHFTYFIQCISVGRKQGLVAFVDADDRPTGRVIEGRQAALIKELICRFVLGAIRLERWFAGLYAWPGKRARGYLANATAPQLPG